MSQVESAAASLTIICLLAGVPGQGELELQERMAASDTKDHELASLVGAGRLLGITMQLFYLVDLSWLSPGVEVHTQMIP